MYCHFDTNWYKFEPRVWLDESGSLKGLLFSILYIYVAKSTLELDGVDKFGSDPIRLHWP